MAVPSDEYVKITLSNAGVTTKDPTTGADIIDKGQLANFERHFKMLERAIMSATNNTAFFSESMKKINEATGQAFKSFYIKKSDYDNVAQALKKADEQIWGKGENARTYLADMEKEDTQLLTFKRKRAGRIAQSLAEEAVKEELSGKAYFASAKDRRNERMSFTIPVTDAEINALGGIEEAKKHYSKKLNEELKLSTKYSSLESKNRKEAEEEKEEREAKKQEEKEKREDIANKRKILRTVAKAVATLVIIANIVRRILTAIASRATDVKKQAEDAVRKSINPIDALAYRNMERARGLTEGTTANAVGSVISAFGQIDSIDDKAMRVLAPVITEKVANAIKSGEGKGKPEEVMKMIINDFYNMANAGKSWTGEYVGKDNASRILTDRLAQFSPDMANILATMLYLNNRSTDYKGKIKGFDSLLDLSNEQTFYSAQKRFMEDLGIEVQEVTAKLKIMKENLLDNLSTPLAEILDWLQNNEAFMTPEEKAKRRYFAGENLREAHGEMERAEKVYTDKAEWLARNINWGDVRGASSFKDLMMKVKADKDIGGILPYLRNQMSTKDYTELLYNFALAKQYGLMKDEATEQLGSVSPEYNKSQYNPYKIADDARKLLKFWSVYIPINEDQALSAYASAYGQISAEVLLGDDNPWNKDLINHFYKGKSKDFSERQKAVMAMFENGEITAEQVRKYFYENVLKSKYQGGVRTSGFYDPKEVGIDPSRLSFANSVAQDRALIEAQEKAFLDLAVYTAYEQLRAQGKIKDSSSVRVNSADYRKDGATGAVDIYFNVDGKREKAVVMDTYGNYRVLKDHYNINRDYANAK